MPSLFLFPTVFEKKLFFLSSDRERCALLRQRVADAGLEEAKEKEGRIALAFLEDHPPPPHKGAKPSQKDGETYFLHLP
ncbi:hypothetical protein MASR1M66_08200 [Aminivibrio sp.]